MGCCVSGPRDGGQKDRNEARSRMRQRTGLRQSHQSLSTALASDGPTAHFSQQPSPAQPAAQGPPQSPPPSSSQRLVRSPSRLFSRPPLPPRLPASPRPPLTRRSWRRHWGESSTSVNLENPHSILGRRFRDVRDDYNLVELLGRSKFSHTFRCTDNSTGHWYVCKAILKKKLVQQSDRDDVRREAEIRQYLSGRPYIAKFKGAYEDDIAVSMVMELCTGGDFYALISSEGKYTERVIASIIRDIVNAVQVCHRKGVMHRDIKPENFLLSNKDEGAVLKAIHFRHARFLQKGEKCHDPINTSYYLAPEAIDGPYGREIDIWSAGVILYMLLSGAAPFYADNSEELRRAIKEGNIDFDRHPWSSVSKSAKELTQMMLTVNPEQRFSPKQVLDFPWIRDGKASDEPMDSAVLARLKLFTAMNNLPKLV